MTHHIILQHQTYHALLKATEEKLELINGPYIHIFIGKRMRGEISTVSHRYTKEDNPYSSDYNPSKPHNYIMLLDAKDVIYGLAMSQTLPFTNLKWVSTNKRLHRIKVHPRSRPRISKRYTNHTMIIHLPQKAKSNKGMAITLELLVSGNLVNVEKLVTI